jgi:hypothetical protein
MKMSKILGRISYCFIILFGLKISLPAVPSLVSWTNTPAFAQPSATDSSSSLTSEELDKKMAEISTSNKPEDMATLAYIWGFPLVNVKRTIDFTTSPNIPEGPGRGPINTLNHFRVFPNANFTDIVRTNVDTLYSAGYYDLKNEPLVLQIPPISDRYYSLQFVDAYSNNFLYIGTRTNDTMGGTYLIAGPNWNGTVPSGMKEIASPSNDGVIAIRTLVNGPADVSTVHSIQDKFVLSPLSIFEGTSSSANATSAVKESGSNASKEIPVAPDPALIPKTGIEIFDEISKDMADNPPPQLDSEMVAKFETIGIGPGKMPSVQVTNDTIRKAMENGIVEGEKLIDEKVRNVGTIVNGWSVNLEIGDYGTDYLLRAAVAKIGLFANSPEEAVYPVTTVDYQGQNLTGANKYVIHFDPGQTPPVNAFWSLTMYNNASYLVDNPIDRYAIGDRSPGLKYNKDGSLDIYIQHDSPGADKESNWLPSPSGDFSLQMRAYYPQESILNGDYQYPPIQRVG